MPEQSIYTESELLRDAEFIRWLLLPTAESDLHWKNLCEESPALTPALENASRIFRESVQFNDFGKSEVEIDDLLLKLQLRIRVRKKRVRLRAIAASAAACAALLIATIYLPHRSPQPASQAELAAGITPAAPLQEVMLYDGQTSIAIKNNTNIVAAALPETAGTSTPGQSVDGNAAMVKLVVPKGRRSTVVLSDGSRIFVNAGSTLSFPKTFTDAEREIFIDGEAYIEVVKDTSRFFVVKARDFEVRVLGTRFAVTSYSDDELGSVVLVSGSVEVNMPGKKNLRLYPNQMLTLNGDSYLVSGVNAADHVSWKNGWLKLDDTRLEDLAVRLSRYYGKEIECDVEVKDLRCSGKLVLSDDMGSVAGIITRNLNIRCTISPDKMRLHR